MTSTEAYGTLLRAGVYLAIDRIKTDVDIQPALDILVNGMHAAKYPNGCREGAEACEFCVRTREEVQRA